MARTYSMEIVDNSHVKLIITDEQGNTTNTNTTLYTNEEALEQLNKHKESWVLAQDDTNKKIKALMEQAAKIEDNIDKLESFIGQLS